MICTCCNQDKHDYHFYSSRGITTTQARFFFGKTVRRSDLCWQCAGPYRCLGCGLEQDASQFRVGGRFCNTCKDAGISTVLPEANTRVTPIAYDHSLGIENGTSNTGFSEDSKS